MIGKGPDSSRDPASHGPASHGPVSRDSSSLEDLATWAAQTPLCDDAQRVVVPTMLDRLPFGNWQR